MCMIGEFVEMRTVPRATPLTGWRTWRIGPAGSLKSDVQTEYTWHRVSHADKCPMPLSTHGLWAFKSQKAARAWSTPQANGSPWGKVALWGRVAVHKDGYRAEHARVMHVVFARFQSCNDPCDACAKDRANLGTARRLWRTAPARGKK